MNSSELILFIGEQAGIGSELTAESTIWDYSILTMAKDYGVGFQHFKSLSGLKDKVNIVYLDEPVAAGSTVGGGPLFHVANIDLSSVLKDSSPHKIVKMMGDGLMGDDHDVTMLTLFLEVEKRFKISVSDEFMERSWRKDIPISEWISTLIASVS